MLPGVWGLKHMCCSECKYLDYLGLPDLEQPTDNSSVIQTGLGKGIKQAYSILPRGGFQMSSIWETPMLCPQVVHLCTD